MAATQMLAAGVKVHTLSARLGHSSTKMTLDVYGEAIPDDDGGGGVMEALADDTARGEVEGRTPRVRPARMIFLPRV